MSNPILSSDLYKDEGDIKKAIEQLKLLRAEYSEAAKTIQNEALKVSVSFKKANVATVEQREQIKKTANQADKLSKEYDKYNLLLDDNAKKLAALKNAQRTQNQINKLEAKLAASKAGSYNALSAEYSLNKIRLNQMTIAERENSEEGKKLVKTSADIYEEMKRLQEVTGKHTLSVGDYGKAMREAEGPLGGFSRGVANAGQSLKALLANPVVLFLSLIAGAATALFGAFSKSEKGANLLAKGAGLLNGLMSTLVDISVGLAETIEFAFSNPQEALKQLGQLLIDQVVNRFQASIDLVGAFGNALKSALTLNLQGVKDAAGEATTALIQLSTGLDSEDQNNFAQAVKEATKEIVEETNAFIDLEAAKRSVRKANRSLVKSIEELSTAEQISRSIADDNTKSFKEREAAAKAAAQAIEQRAAKEIELAKNNLRLLNTEVDLRRSNGEEVEDLLDRQLDAYREVKTAERELSLARLDNERTVNELQQDRLERDLDILIDGFDNQKTINERKIANDKLTLSERARILDETARLAEDSFAKQIETIQKFTGVAVDANSLIGESDAVALNQKIRSLGLSEIIEGRLLEIVRERRLATADLSEAEADLAEARTVKAAKEAEIEKQILAEKKQSEIELFEQQQELAKSEFDLLEKTAKEKEDFTLRAEAERLQKILDLNEEFAGDLTKLQQQTIKNQIEAIQNQLESVATTQVNDIYDLFGLSLNDKQKDSLNSSFAFTKKQLTELAQQRNQIADRNVQSTNQEVSSAEAALQREIDNRNAGFADKVSTREKELELAKESQRKALNEQKKAQRAEQRIRDAETVANMIVAVSKNFRDLGAAGVVSNAIMLGAFVAAKVRARQLSKVEFREGGLEIIGGGSHASGNDTPLGFSKGGKQAYGERGEAHMILKRKATSKAKSILPQIFKSLNRGTFENDYMARNEMISPTNNVLIDFSKAEDELSKIRQQGERIAPYRDSNGNLVVTLGNRTITYV
jgi:hypothetical protein